MAIRSTCAILCITWVVCQSGCRVLRSRDTRDLTTARQLSLRGADLLEQRKYSDAESLFIEALRQSPSDERAEWGLAEVLWQGGEREQATLHMARAVELSGSNPDLLVRFNPDWSVRLGQMYLELGKVDLASQQAELVLRNHRNNSAAWALKAEGLRLRGDLESAISAYHRALIYRSDWPEVQVAVAELYRMTNRPHRALATIDRLCDQHSGSQLPPRVHLLRGQSLADLGEIDAARLCLRQASPTLPQDQPAVLLELAAMQRQLGDLVEARLCVSRVLRTDPNNPTAIQIQTELDELFARHNAPEEKNGSNVPIFSVSAPIQGK